jgi:drug/metabolite transporter (DMT)-like permease
VTPTTIRQRRLAIAALVGAAFIFGTTFTTVKRATEDVAPLPFITVRFIVGSVVLMPLAARRPRTPGVGRAGVLAGLALAVGYVAQTVGLQYTDESTSAFITYMLVVFVPLISAVLSRTWPTRTATAGVALAAVGLFLLSSRGGSIGLGRGESLTLLCALGFASHIIVLDRFAGRQDVFWLNVVQLATVGALCVIPGVVAGGYRFPLAAWLAAVYLGVAASACAFMLQTWAQTHIEPTRASLLLILEPVFAAMFSALLGHPLGVRGIAGAACIFVGILVVERRRRLHATSDGVLAADVAH